MGQIHVDEMTLEILCTDLRDFRAKSVGAVSKNVFYQKRPDGGARGGPCEKSGCDLAPKECVCVCVQSLAWIGATVPKIKVD